MKSYNNLWNEFISFENLHLAYKKARESKPNKEKVLEFGLNLEKNLFNLKNQLLNNKYNVSKYYTFKIYEPKERVISSPAFKDVVVQHALINVIEPIFEKSFIYDSFACRKNKGIHKGLSRLKNIIQSNNSPKYYMKCDVKKYFPSVNKKILKKIISKKLKDKKILKILYKIIDSYNSKYGENKGIPIGNLTSQLFANIYLNELDQFVKHKLKSKYYFRYVDDFIVLSNSKKELNYIGYKITKFLNYYLDLEMPKNKTYINLIENGVDFVGYKVFKNYIKIRKSNLKNFIKKTKYNLYLYNNYKITKNSLESSVCSYLGYFKHGNCFYISNILFDRYFCSLKYLLDKAY